MEPLTALSDIVLLFGNVEGTENILQLSENERFEFIPPDDEDADTAAWRGDQDAVDLKGPLLCLVFGQHMFSPIGWFCGSLSDSDECDLQVAKDNQTGVSRRHFRIDVSPQGYPRLRNVSQNPVYLHGENSSEPICLQKDEDAEIVSPVTIDLGEVRLRAWRPILSKDQERLHKKNAQKFHNEYMGALPRPAPDSSIPTAKIRSGSKNTRYIQEEGVYHGVGAYAHIMKVRELTSRECFAAKVPHYKLSDGPALVRQRWELISQEFDKLTTLKHAHIVEAIEIVRGSHDFEPPWLIMEWLPLDLRSLPLEHHEIPTLLKQVSSGLAFMHANGFAHRDLKPENILIHMNEQGFFAKIADVGEAKYKTHGIMKTFIGSVAYMAPELWKEDRAYTNAVDMWSLGIIAIELWTQWDSMEMEFEAKQQESRVWIRDSVMPRLKDTPAAFELLLRGLLSKLPAERWTAESSDEWLGLNTQAPVHVSASDKDRHVRSPHPILSTTRAGTTSPQPSIPDTEPWGSSDSD